MISPHRADARRAIRPTLRAAAAAGVGWVTILARAADGPVVDERLAGWTVPLLLVVLAALPALVATAWIVVGLLRERHRLIDRLRASADRSRCLESLLPVWIWQSDAKHRLLDLRPVPAAAGAVRPAASEPILERFAVDEPAALRDCLARRASFDGIAARPASDVDAPAGRLAGQPYSSGTGEFAGYHGVFEPGRGADAATPAGADRSATAAETASVAGEHELLSFTVSHDLRAPIRVVEGFTKILKEDYGPALDRIGNDHLDRVLGAAARMNNMIDALMALSRLSSQPLVRQPVNLSQLGQYVIDDLRRQWPEREITVSIEPGLQAEGDPTLLRIVLENLLGNAWKYTGKASAATIGFGRRPGSDDTYTVADNGAGFDMRFADRLFGVFQRLHGAAEFPGTGIGLATVRRIVRRHGGEIWGEAEPNQGARFHFSLPRL